MISSAPVKGSDSKIMGRGPNTSNQPFSRGMHTGKRPSPHPALHPHSKYNVLYCDAALLNVMVMPRGFFTPAPARLSFPNGQTPRNAGVRRGARGEHPRRLLASQGRGIRGGAFGTRSPRASSTSGRAGSQNASLLRCAEVLKEGVTCSTTPFSTQNTPPNYSLQQSDFPKLRLT